MTAAFSGALEALRDLLSGVPGLGWVTYAPYAFRPFVLVVVLALVVGPVSTIVNLRRLEFNAEAMVHSVFPGVVAAAVWWGTRMIIPGAALAASGSLIWISPATVLIDVLTLAMLALLMRREGRSLADLYRPFLLRDIGWGLLAFIGTVVVWFVASFIGNLIAYHGAPPMGAMSARLPMWAGLLCFAVMPLTIALAEEGLYRGYLQPRIGVRFGAGMALVVPALAFSLQHLGFALSSPEAAVAKLVTTLIAGLFFGALMMAWKRTMPTVIAHWMLDLLFLGLPILMMAL